MDDRRFTGGIEAQHRRIDVDAYDTIYVVGDVHGCRTAVERLFDELALGADDLVVFLGDLIRRDPDSRGVVVLFEQADREGVIRTAQVRPVGQPRSRARTWPAADRRSSVSTTH